MKIWRARRQSGASMVEFVVVAPIALLLILCIIQIGFLLVGKITLNHAAFMAARVGAVNNADAGQIKDAAYKVLLPFWQDSTESNELTRVTKAYAAGYIPNLGDGEPFSEHSILSVTVLNPSPASFRDFGYADPLLNKTVIPNDSLAYRSNTVGSASKQTLQDANLLKIKVTYGFKLKVPLMPGLIKSLMCGNLVGSSPVSDWGSSSMLPMDTSNCVKYYYFGRIPLTTYATVRMQSPAYQ